MKLLFNGRFRTLDPANPFASAVLVDAYGSIAAVGDSDALKAACPVGTEMVNLEGQTVWPGLTDAHLHLQYYAGSLQQVDCEVPTKDECLRRVSERTASEQLGKWIRGHGWNQNVWGGFGSLEELDAVSPHHPVFLTDKSIHAAWANSMALKQAAITDATPDPAGGTIVRDSKGHATGILLENATDLVYDILPEPTEHELADMLITAQQSLHRFGLTGVHDFDRAQCFNALQILNDRHELRLRVLKSIPMDGMRHAAELGLRSGFGNQWLRIGNVKCFADGALGPQTATMLSPYEGSQEVGTTILSTQEMVAVGQAAIRQGFSLAIHAIGDRANKEVLDAYEELRRFEVSIGAAPLRHRIEHLQLVHPSDFERLEALNIIASMQPYHVISDMFTADRFWGLRTDTSYAWKSVLDVGARLAFGSDSPVESPNPFWGLHAAITRQRADGQPGQEGWHPEQRISLLDGLHAYTTGAAYAAGWERQIGQLAAGYMADLIVLKDDPFNLPPAAVRDILPSAVMVGGEWVMRN